MFLHGDYRGKEKGIAQRLLDTALAWSRDQRIEAIYLGTVECLHAARRFYEKNKFEPIPAEDLPSSFPRMAVDTHFYRCSLITQ